MMDSTYWKTSPASPHNRISRDRARRARYPNTLLSLHFTYSNTPNPATHPQGNPKRSCCRLNPDSESSPSCSRLVFGRCCGLEIGGGRSGLLFGPSGFLLQDQNTLRCLIVHIFTSLSSSDHWEGVRLGFRWEV